MHDPIDPKHPIFLSEAPHAFMTPYALLVAAFAKLFSISPIDALAIAGLLNFLLLAYGLKRFCFVISSACPEKTAFYFLLFTLLLWGNNPWPYSGFFHLDVIGFVLPYPSTFAIAISLIGLSFFSRSFKANNFLHQFGLCLIIWVVLLSHPLTFIFLMSGLFFLCFYPQGLWLSRILILFSLLLVALMAAFFWPYYSIRHLLTGSSSVFHTSNFVMYYDVLKRIWINIALLPLLIWAFKERSARIILIWFASLCTLYFLGFLTGHYSYGRIISFCILLLHLLAAEGLARFEINLQHTRRIAVQTYRVLLFLSLLFFSLTWLPSTLTRMLTIVNQASKHQSINNQITYKNLLFISKYLKHNDLVLSDIETSWLIPTFGGKVIAALHPQAFIPDLLTRQKNIEVFFHSDTGKDQRLSILRQYHPDFLVLDQQLINASLIEAELADFVEFVDGNNQYKLYKIRRLIE